MLPLEEGLEKSKCVYKCWPEMGGFTAAISFNVCLKLFEKL